MAPAVRATADGAGHVHYTKQSMLKEDDPLYPCNAIAEKYRRECYFLQSSAISLFNDNDFGATLKVCDTVPTKYVQVCYQSAGRDISGFTLGQPARDRLLPAGRRSLRGLLSPRRGPRRRQPG